jgi:glycosyltransferase involved in cell wall biosynthesis
MPHVPCFMKIGIDASRAFQKQKTGIEEYSYQVIKHLRDFLKDDEVILFCNPAINIKPDFDLPKNWRIRNLNAPIFWTQIRLSLEMLFHPINVLFVPAHTVPLIHPKNTIVTIHGLEYEFCPKAFSFWQRFYMRFVIKNSCRWAKKIIAVSENTKGDLMRLYKVSESKIKVFFEGYEKNIQYPISNIQKNTKYQIPNTKYFLFVGRLEERKNICGIIEAFEILKDKYKISQKLILIGKFGFGGEEIKSKIDSSEYRSDIILTGYVSDENKFYLLANADAFLFPTFYEGFGLPIIEAQSVGTPVVTSNISSMPEVANGSAVLVDPKDINTIVEAAYRLVSDESYKNDIIKKGYDNIKRFSWEKCARDISNIMQIC